MATTNQQVTYVDPLRTTTRGTLNLIEVSALFGIDGRTASRGADAGEIPHRKTQNRYVVPTSWVRDFVFGENLDHRRPDPPSAGPTKATSPPTALTLEGGTASNGTNPSTQTTPTPDVAALARQASPPSATPAPTSSTSVQRSAAANTDQLTQLKWP